MRFGIYVGSRAGAACAGPADLLRIGPLVDDLAGGSPFVIREYVRWCGGDTALEQEIGAAGDLDHLTMPDDWYVTGGRELDLVLSSAATINSGRTSPRSHTPHSPHTWITWDSASTPTASHPMTTSTPPPCTP
jgi:hypothetical protein